MLVTNYLEEAERELRTMRGCAVADRLYKPYIQSTLDEAVSAVKFYLPEGGYVLDEHMKGIQNVQVNLPYKRITLEWKSPFGSTDVASRILLVEQFAENYFSFKLFLKCVEPLYPGLALKWMILPGTMIHAVNPATGITVAPVNIGDDCIKRMRECVEEGRDIAELARDFPKEIEIMNEIEVLGHHCARPFLNNKRDRLIAKGFSKSELHVCLESCEQSETDAMHIEFSLALGVFLSFVEALSCSNVSHSKAPPRVRKPGEKGMFPKYKFEYKILTIDGDAGLYDPLPIDDNEAEAKDGTVSKRTVIAHFRRGHIHRCPTKLGIVKQWRKPIIVNPNSPKGFLDKDYRLK